MPMKKFIIGISYIETLDISYFNDFISESGISEKHLILKRTPNDVAYLCNEWLIPTAIVVYISNQYFKSFLGEMAKDHHKLLKTALSNLYTKIVLKSKIEPVLVSTEGKINRNNPYTMSYSIVIEASNGYKFKLLLPKFDKQFNSTKACATFINFMNDFHTLGSESQAVKIINESGVRGGEVLIRYNQETEKIEWQDHLPPSIRAERNKTKN